MSETESQFVLAAYRPDGSDAANPEMAAALATARENPDLRSRFEAQLAFDRSVAEAMGEVAVPEGLRDTILAGAEVSARPGRRARRWVRAALLPAAAAVAAAAVVVATVGRPDQPEWASASLAALKQLHTGQRAFDVTAPSHTEAIAWLATQSGGEVQLPGTLGSLPAYGCTFVESDEGEVSLVCFDAGSGRSVHLAVYRATGPGAAAGAGPDGLAEVPAVPTGCKLSDCGGWVTTTWRDGNRCFVLMAANLPGAHERLRSLVGIGERV